MCLYIVHVNAINKYIDCFNVFPYYTFLVFFITSFKKFFVFYRFTMGHLGVLVTAISIVGAMAYIPHGSIGEKVCKKLKIN